MVEYLSDLNEKWMVRKVNFCNFGPVQSPVWEEFIFFVSANIRILGISANFKKFLKILKLASEKLYFQRILYGRIFVRFT